MKKTIIYLLISFGMILLAGCSDDTFQLSPQVEENKPQEVDSSTRQLFVDLSIPIGRIIVNTPQMPARN